MHFQRIPPRGSTSQARLKLETYLTIKRSILEETRKLPPKVVLCLVEDLLSKPQN